MIRRIKALGIKISTYGEGERTLALITVILIGLAIWGYVDAVSPKMGSVDYLSYKVETDRDSYSPGEAPVLRIYLTNQMRHPVYIERVSRIGYTFLVSIYHQGKRFISQVGCPYLGYMNEAHEEKALQRMLMRPGETRVYTFNLSEYDWFDQDSFGEFTRELDYLEWERGTYEVEVYYVQRCSRCHYEIRKDQYKWLGRVRFEYR
jgi:hypothetical protein